MKLAIINTSIVLAGQVYRPAVFTPEFLRSAKIVKKSWELVDQPVATPALALLKYNNGIIIEGQPNRVQIIDGNPSSNVKAWEIKEVATKFLRHLNYARHTAVGFNVAALIEMEDALAYLRAKFLKEGSWGSDILSGVGVELTIPRRETTLNIAFALGSAQLAGEVHQREGVLITANYHTPISESFTIDAATREAANQIEQLSVHYEDFRTLMPSVFELEDDTNAAE